MKPKFVNLYEISANLSPARGASVRLKKYKAKLTINNYLPAITSDEDAKNGYDYGFSSRVKVGDIMKIESIGNDSSEWIHRRIFFIDGQEAEAKKLLRTTIDKLIENMVTNINAMKLAWDKR